MQLKRPEQTVKCLFIEMFIEIYFFSNFFSAITDLILSQLYYNVENSLHILNIAYINPNQKLIFFFKVYHLVQQVYIYIYYRKSTFHYESDRMCSISGSEYMEESIYEESDNYISFNK